MSAVQQYIDLYHSQKDLIAGHSSPVMNALRDEAMALLESKGLPTLKDEEYRRTDIESLYAPDYGLNLGRVNIEINPYEVFRCDVPNLSTLLYFVVNDTFYTQAQPAAAKLPEGVVAGSLCEMARQYPQLVARYYGKAADMKTRRHGGAQHRLCPGRILPLYPRRGGGREAHPAGEYTAG